jgi:Mg-chelatase subunit ChlD
MSEIEKKPDASLDTSSLDTLLEQLGVRVHVPKSHIGAVYLLLDSSHGMTGSKHRDAVAGAKEFAAEAVRSGYRTGVISFSSGASLISEVTDDVLELSQHLDGVAAGGSTNMTDAIALGASLLVKGFQAGRARVLVLFTDGQPDDKNATIRAADDAKHRGIEIICRGTEDADLDLLKRLGSRSDLVQVVVTSQLRQGIAQAVRLLPGYREEEPGG